MRDDDHPRVMMAPMVLFGIAIVASALFELVVPLALMPAPGLQRPWSWLGVLLFAGGYWLALAGRREFIRAKTNVFPHLPALNLVTTGPYRISRNPMYLGLIAGLLGISVAFSLEMGLVVLAGLALALHFGVVLREERYLTRKFGAPYEAFLRRTRRWL
jgi:protein-S-isoprenylcysteine O-methyltransferase Ste14